MHENSELSAFYRDRGLMGRVGFGERPAVLVVDYIKGFTDPDSPLGADYTDRLAAARRVLDAAREQDLPIFFTTIVYSKSTLEYSPFLEKIPSLGILTEDSDYVDVDPALGFDPSREILIRKRQASAFFGTSLVEHLVGQRVDTLVIVGCTTSGCIRATAVDACQYGFRTIVVEDAVGDRAEAPHRANLFDLDAKYADVEPAERVLEHLSALQTRIGG